MAEDRPRELGRYGPYVRPIVVGSLVAAIGIAPWVVSAYLNARIRPDLPWAAIGTAVFLVLYIAWLNGTGWPASSQQARKRSLRLWPPTASREQGSDTMPAPLIVLLLALLTVVWIIIGRLGTPPDVSAYPTTAYRFSVFIMGAVVSGVVEEAAYRGYMQTNLERHDPQSAILLTSIVFTLFHGVHGLGALLMLGPGIFAASVLYGLLARRTGTIVPGMIIHATGDLAYTYFGMLRGDGTLLFAP
jgi:membrane protease YdiL (CAAX protease family)